MDYPTKLTYICQKIHFSNKANTSLLSNKDDMHKLNTKHDKLLTVYEPNVRQGGLWWGVCRASRELWSSRYVIFYLFRRDFLAQFKQKLFGYLWAVLGPFLSIASFLFLFFTGVLQPGVGNMPYTVYVLIGSTIWTSLPTSLSSVSTGLQGQADLIMRTRVPKIALALATLANVCYGIFISMLTILAVLLIFDMRPSWYFALYPLLVAPLLLAGLAVGLVLAVLGSIMKDLTQMVMQALSFVMYVTPVIYVFDSIKNQLVKNIIMYNPLTYLVDVPRSLIVLGHSAHVGTYLIIYAAVLVAVVVGFRIFYLLEDLVAERL